MYPNTVQMNCCSVVLLYRLIIFLVFINGIYGHKCYVCKEDCKLFDINTKFKYEQECPPKSTTCIAEIRGGAVTVRSCEEEHNSLNDCKKLGTTKYCYCSKELCNDVLADTSTPNANPVSDDEDDEFDGSGNGSNDQDDVISILQPVIPKTTKIDQSSAAHLPKSSITILILFTQYYQSI